MDSRNDVEPVNFRQVMTYGLIGLLMAGALAFAVDWVNAHFQTRPETGVIVISLLFGLTTILPVLIYVFRNVHALDPVKIALILLVGISICLLSIYLYQVRFEIMFPGDFLIWSESDFVNDIIKFRVNYPIYSDLRNNDSFVYPVGTQLLTYFIASIFGLSTSIQAYRIIQLGFTVIAALAALYSILVLISLSEFKLSKDQRLYGMLALPILLLIATNPITNPFIHNLHNDSTAQLISIIVFALLLAYIRNRKSSTVIALALVTATGLWFKQNLVIWAVFILVYLIVFDQPRSTKNIALFATISFSAIALIIGVSYLLWGEHYFYWIFEVLGSAGVSPLRSFRNLLTVWPLVALGLIGGLLILPGQKFRLLIGPWLIWLGFIGIEIVTSGIAWMVNHIGPGTLIAGVWFLAGLIKLREFSYSYIRRAIQFERWVIVATATFLLILYFSSQGLIRIPTKPDMADYYRYFSEIEQEFIGNDPQEILLDVGSWVYISEGVVMKDRSPSLGERGYSQTADFTGILERIKEKTYTKILVRNLHADDFWYDHYLWDVSSGIRQTLLENYMETGQIDGVVNTDRHLTAPISIMVPRNGN